MQGAWQEIQAGWKDARWSLYFGLFLLPFTLAAFLIAYAIEGRISTPPSALTWCFIAPLALLSFVLAGLWDGPDSRFGKRIWRVVLTAVSLWLVRRALRTGSERQAATIRLAGHGFSVEVIVIEVETEPVGSERWESVRYRWRRRDQDSEQGLLIPH